ncbi:unnamed protein product, partial [Linum tenue]
MSKKNNLSKRKKQYEFELQREKEEREKQKKKLQAKKNKMKVSSVIFCPCRRFLFCFVLYFACWLTLWDILNYSVVKLVIGWFFFS